MVNDRTNSHNISLTFTHVFYGVNIHTHTYTQREGKTDRHSCMHAHTQIKSKCKFRKFNGSGTDSMLDLWNKNVIQLCWSNVCAISYVEALLLQDDDAV